MNYQQVVGAKRAVDEISRMQFPLRIAYNLFKLKKKLDMLFEFEVDQEKKTVEKYGGVINADGSIKFPDKATTEIFGNAMTKLLQTEIDEEVEPVVINTDDAGDISITPDLIWKLDGFVNFE